VATFGTLQAAACTGSTPTPPTASSTSSPRSAAPSPWASSSTNGAPLGPDRIGPATGHVTALYNGQVYQGNPRDIPLNAHAQIQLETGTPLIAPETITFPSGL
jgi:hypothetical protein